MKPPVPSRRRSPTPITAGMSQGGRSEGPPPPWGLLATVGLRAGVGAGARRGVGAGAVGAEEAAPARKGAAEGASGGVGVPVGGEGAGGVEAGGGGARGRVVGWGGGGGAAGGGASPRPGAPAARTGPGSWAELPTRSEWAVAPAEALRAWERPAAPAPA